MYLGLLFFNIFSLTMKNGEAQNYIATGRISEYTKRFSEKARGLLWEE